MKTFFNISLFVSLLAILSSCTSARWTVKEKNAVDKNEYRILQQEEFLMPAAEVTPENPTLKLDLFSKTKYEYKQRVLMQRNIQKYHLQPGAVALGVGGAAAAFYLANFSSVNGVNTNTKKWTLNAAGALFLASGFMNMKPVGGLRPTGEEKYLRNTGVTTDVDTVKIENNDRIAASVSVRHNGELVFNENQRSFAGSLEITLGNKLEELQLTGPDPGSISISVDFNDSTYVYEYPVSQILQPYAQVTSRLTELRNSPEKNTDNILADLAKGSRLQVKSYSDKKWFNVLYGISENYIKKQDARLIWRTADFVQEEQVVTVPRVPFGNIDVESNIPILRGPTPNAIALIITNENYSTVKLEQRRYTHRDGRLIKTYLQNGLGYSKENIFELHDVRKPAEINKALSSIRSAVNDSTKLFVYLGGYGQVQRKGEEVALALLGVSGDGESPSTVGLPQLFEKIAALASAQTLVLTDIDFSSKDNGNRFTPNEEIQIIENNTAPLRSIPNTTILMGSRLNNPSNLYVSPGGEDKKHHIFPYFFAKALQQRKTSLSAIYQYMERNVSYTARRLFDRPQDPLLLGNSSFDLISE